MARGGVRSWGCHLVLLEPCVGAGGSTVAGCRSYRDARNICRGLAGGGFSCFLGLSVQRRLHGLLQKSPRFVSAVLVRLSRA